MFAISKVMIVFAIVLTTIMYWATSNVCRYNFVIDKKTNELNVLMQEIGPSIGSAKAFYFKELNCNNVEFSFNFERVLKNLETLSVMIYQELSTDIKGDPN